MNRMALLSRTNGNISLDEPSFLPTGTAVFQADKTLGANPQRPMAVVGRVLEVVDGRRVIGVAGNFESQPDRAGVGFHYRDQGSQ